MNRITDSEQSVSFSHFMCKNTKVDLELTVIKTPEWGASMPEGTLRLLENCMVNFCSELKKYNFPQGKIKVDHSSNHYGCDGVLRPIDYPSCEYTSLPHTPESLKSRNIFLHSKDFLWAQFSYQYLHEFCHYMTATITNNWFLESLCELSSIYFMKKMSKMWKTKPPYPNWVFYRKHLNGYAQSRLNETTKLDIPLVEWYAINKATLFKDSCKRELNNVVAKYYLPYFEKMPYIWNIVCYVPFEDIKDFNQFMYAWRDNCPNEYKGYINKFITDLGL